MDTKQKPSIAAFDFDGTITKVDTFVDFIIKNCKLSCLFSAIGINFFPLVLCFVKVGSFGVLKERIFSRLFKGISEDKFNEMCFSYSLKRLPEIINKEALEKIKWHMVRGHKLVIVSASIKNWIEPWAKNNGFEKVISTEPEAKNGVLIDKFKTKNCNGSEKVVRFLKEYPNRESYYLYAYGDSYKDKQLLDLADEKFFRTFYK